MGKYKDPEGKYRPEFVEEILRISKVPGQLYEFTTKDDFLRRIDAYRSLQQRSKNTT